MTWVSCFWNFIQAQLSQFFSLSFLSSSSPTAISYGMLLLEDWNHEVKAGQASHFTGQGVCRLLLEALPLAPTLSVKALSVCKVQQATVWLALQWVFFLLCLQSQLGNSYAGFAVPWVFCFFHLNQTEHRNGYLKRMEKTGCGY